MLVVFPAPLQQTDNLMTLSVCVYMRVGVGGARAEQRMRRGLWDPLQAHGEQMMHPFLCLPCVRVWVASDLWLSW